MNNRPRHLVLTNGKKEYRVFVFKWWPGSKDVRYINTEYQHLIKRCKLSGSNYLTYALALIDGKSLSAYSRCMKDDQPRKRYGTDKALGRLRQKAMLLGYDWKQYE